MSDYGESELNAIELLELLWLCRELNVPHYPGNRQRLEYLRGLAEGTPTVNMQHWQELTSRTEGTQ